MEPVAEAHSEYEICCRWDVWSIITIERAFEPLKVAILSALIQQYLG